jgi:hypothetical protein
MNSLLKFIGVNFRHPQPDAGQKENDEISEQMSLHKRA